MGLPRVGHSRPSQEEERAGAGRKKKRKESFKTPLTLMKEKKKTVPGKPQERKGESYSRKKEGWRNGKWHQEKLEEEIYKWRVMKNIWDRRKEVQKSKKKRRAVLTGMIQHDGVTVTEHVG